MAKPASGKPAKKKKEPFLKRQLRHAREAGDLGKTLVVEPRRFPGKCGSLLKRSLRGLWEARGGGYYACGFVVCFIWLEIKTLASEIAAASGVGSFVSEQLFEFLFRFSMQSLANTIQSFLWPLMVIDRYEHWGIVGLVLGYLLFAYVLKERISKWLFAGDEQETGTENTADPGSA